MKALYKKYTLVGPGGINCPCCAPRSGNRYAARARVIVKRQAKRRELAALRREVDAEIRA